MAEDVPQNPITSPPDLDSTTQQTELQTLETKLSSNPSNYDAHVQYIKFPRKMGELDTIHNGDHHGGGHAPKPYYISLPIRFHDKAQSRAPNPRDKALLQPFQLRRSCPKSSEENGRVGHNPQRRSPMAEDVPQNPTTSPFRLRFRRLSPESGAPNPRDEALLQPFQLRRSCPLYKVPEENERVKHNPQRRSAHGGGCAPKPYDISRFRFRFQRRSLAENGAPNPRDEALLQPFQLRRLCPVYKVPEENGRVGHNPQRRSANGEGRAPKSYYISCFRFRF
ncbi:squamous cell carcinoma antigen recognized by T-cells 3-like [Fagus crenata]